MKQLRVQCYDLSKMPRQRSYFGIKTIMQASAGRDGSSVSFIGGSIITVRRSFADDRFAEASNLNPPISLFRNS